MLPNGEVNVNSRYAAQDLRRDTRQTPNLRHCHRSNRLDAGVDAHRAHWRHTARCPPPRGLYSGTASFKKRCVASIEATLRWICSSICITKSFSFILLVLLVNKKLY